ncbi:MAG: hypothetical protein L3K15_04100 [Thermoplasmata archaeon]|nr:hypothetical protein [Thermoplasmata archaeon]
MSGPDGPPLLRLSAAIPRSPSLGPFASARDALKFLAYAVVGAVVAGFVSPWAWLPFLAVGFAVGARRSDGAGFDRRVADFLGWAIRCRGRAGGSTARSRRPVREGRAVAEVGAGTAVAILRSEGIPVAFLPPTNARDLFAEYCRLLGSLDGGVALLVRGRPLATRTLLPRTGPGAPEEVAARRGYAEMLGLLGRHRRRREVLIALGGPTGSAAALSQIERRTGDLQDRLGTLGIVSERLRGPSLAEGLVAFGWPAGGST